MGWARTLAPGQRCRVHVIDVASGISRIVHEDGDVLLEAPNWTAAGELILNGDGVLWRMPADGSVAPVVIRHDDLPELNNDHVLSPGGETIFVSANDGHLYEAPLAGGAVRRITDDGAGHWHFLHGVSPDGSRLAYVALNPERGWDSGVVHSIGVDGSDDRPVTAGKGPDDGPEWSPDGEWLYLNTERFTAAPGHAQIARMRADGTDLQQLTSDERVNWFPHLDPTGRRVAYLSYPPGTVGHPADLDVELRLVEDGDWAAATTVVALRGGQGTFNVNSWSPDGARFAFIDYPTAEEPA